MHEYIYFFRKIYANGIVCVFVTSLRTCNRANVSLSLAPRPAGSATLAAGAGESQCWPGLGVSGMVGLCRRAQDGRHLLTACGWLRNRLFGRKEREQGGAAVKAGGSATWETRHWTVCTLRIRAARPCSGGGAPSRSVEERGSQPLWVWSCDKGCWANGCLRRRGRKRHQQNPKDCQCHPGNLWLHGNNLKQESLTFQSVSQKEGSALSSDSLTLGVSVASKATAMQLCAPFAINAWIPRLLCDCSMLFYIILTP